MQTLEHETSTADEQGDDVAARHESATGAARGAGRSALLAAVLGLTLAGAAACGSGSDDAEVTPTPASAASSAPETAEPSPEATEAEESASAMPVPSATTKGPITILSPAEGSGVGRTFLVKGRSTSFEGALVWELVKADDTAVARGTAQGGSDGPAPYQFTVKAPAAGSYTIRVFEESAKDGTATNEVRRAVVVG
jgi:hypothetical protein